MKPFAEAWRDYEKANRRAHLEYVKHPSRQPRLYDHSQCLCCTVQTVQFGVCLLCRRRDPEWDAIADDTGLLFQMRRALSHPLQDTG